MTYQEALTNLKKVISENCINIKYNESEYEKLPITKTIECKCKNIENHNKYYVSILKYSRPSDSQINTIFDCDDSDQFNNLITAKTINYLTGNNLLTAEIENDCEFINRLYHFCLLSLCYIEYISDTELTDREYALSPGRPSSKTLNFTYKMGLCYKRIQISSNNYNSTESNKNIKVTDITSLLNSIVKNNKNLLLPCNVYYGAYIYLTNPGSLTH